MKSNVQASGIWTCQVSSGSECYLILSFHTEFGEPQNATEVPETLLGHK